MIKVEKLGYKIGKKQLLKDISFESHPGELMAIVGANGAGKSTLLKLLCGDQASSSGTISIREKSINAYTAHELARFRSVLSQQNTLSFSFTVRELVLMGRYPHFEQQPRAHDFEVVDRVLEELGMVLFQNRAYHTLSGGEQQRVQLARVLAQIYDQQGGILLLDEPTNGLDLRYQQQVLQLARDLTDRGYCVISILHDINYAARFADKVLMLKLGEMVAFGDPLNVVNCENIHDVFGIKVKLMACDDLRCPLVVPSL